MLPAIVSDWWPALSLFTFLHWRRKWQPSPVFLPGESRGRWSLVGCHLWGCRVGHDWSDLAAAAAAAACRVDNAIQLLSVRIQIQMCLIPKPMLLSEVTSKVPIRQSSDFLSDNYILKLPSLWSIVLHSIHFFPSANLPTTVSSLSGC